MPDLKKILITGSNGQLGRSLKSLLSNTSHYQLFFAERNALDLSNKQSIADYFKQHTFDLVINCAAYTAVDLAEEQQHLAYAINHLAVKQLAETALQNNSILIQISTDYVFDGNNYLPYSESHQTHAQSVYGASKLQGEIAIQAIAPQAIIIRTSWLYSEFGQNFVKTMLKLGQEREQLNLIFDQIGSPTYAKDLAEAILTIIDSAAFKHTLFQKDKVHLYHYSNEGVCSWYDFAKTIFELSNTACQVNPIETKDYPTAAKRPHFSVLNKAKIKQSYDLAIPYWKDSLQNCLNQLKEK